MITAIGKLKAVIPMFAFLMALNFMAPAATTFVPSAYADTVGVTDQGYTPDSNNILHAKVEKIVKIVAGVGGVGFVLAILIISLFIIFGSISASKMGTWWKALFSCIAGAFIFFSAYSFAPSIAALAK